MASDADDRRYSARDVQKVAGLSARQLNDWDGRDALPHGRSGKEGWRRFSVREVFVLSVSAALRRQFGTPLERLKSLQDFMLQDGANHFVAAVDLMATLGVGVWIVTDLEDTFVMDSELEFADLWRNGAFGASREKALIYLPVNPLVNRILAALKDPMRLEAHGRGHQLMRDIRAKQEARTPEEVLLLDMIRCGEFTKVEVQPIDGEIATIRTTSHPDPSSEVEALLSEPYQSLRLTKKDGKVVSIVQEVVTRPKKGR